MTLGAAQQTLIAQQGGRAKTAPVHHLKLLQVFQPWNLDDVLGICHALGYTGILVKALDGIDWMGRYDSSPSALRSLEELQQQVARARAEGLYYFTWTNPLTQTANDLALEATLTGQIARSCDGLFLDVEPYRQFWGSNAPAFMAQQFMRWVRGEAPNAFLALQPDPRQSALQAIRVDEWLPYVDAFAAQHYWSDFGTDPSAEMARAVYLGQLYGLPILPTLPGNASGRFPLGQIAQLPGFVVWRYGTTPGTTLATLGGSAVAGLISSRILART